MIVQACRDDRIDLSASDNTVRKELSRVNKMEVVETKTALNPCLWLARTIDDV